MISIRCPTNAINFHVDLSKNNEPWDTLSINEPISIQSAVELIQKPWFRQRFFVNNSAIAILFSIDGEINENITNTVKQCEHNIVRPLLISFAQAREKKICLYWKKRDSKFLSMMLSIGDDDITAVGDFLRAFIVNEIKSERSGKFLKNDRKN